MFRLAQSFVSLKQTVLRSVIPIFGEEKSAVLQPSHLERHLASVSQGIDTKRKVRPRPIYLKGPIDIAGLGSLGFFRESTDTLSASPTTSDVLSLYSQESWSSSTNISTPDCTSPIPIIVTTDYDAQIEGCRPDIEWEYKEFLLSKGRDRKVCQAAEPELDACCLKADAFLARHLAPPVEFVPCGNVSLRRSRTVIRKENHPIFWNCIDAPIPSEYGYTVVVPATGRGATRTLGKSFKIGGAMFSFHTLVKYLAEETRRPCHDNIKLVSRVYPDIIDDQKSYDAWLAWKTGRPAEDRMLWVRA